MNALVFIRKRGLYPSEFKNWPVDGIESCQKSTIVSSPVIRVDFYPLKAVNWI